MSFDEGLKILAEEHKRQEDANKALAEEATKEREEYQKQVDELKNDVKALMELGNKPKEEPKEVEAKTPEEDQIEKNFTRFERFLKIIRGKDDPRSHITVITNPNLEHLLSSTRLSEIQVRAIVNCKMAAAARPEFKPLGDFADTICKAEISGGEGWGTNKGIELAEAYAPRVASIEHNETHEVKQHWYNRKKKEEPSRADR